MYTRRGDDGSSALVDGARRPKSAAVFDALGAADELSAHLGLARAHIAGSLPPSPAAAAVSERLVATQRALYQLGAHIATLRAIPFEAPDARVAELEAEVDRMNAEMPPLAAFVLPAGGVAAAQLHVCRTVCRRAERALSVPAVRETVDPGTLRFLNRLSDYLFVAARRCAHLDGSGDTLAAPK